MRQSKLRDYRDETLVDDDAAAHVKLLAAPKGKRLLHQMATAEQLYTRYDDYEKNAAAIIRMIAAYPGMPGH